MEQVILIHGLPDHAEILDNTCPSPSNAHWFPWIQKQLTRQDILCQALEMPRSYNPVYKDHERVLNQMEISGETILVGHSSGGGFLLRYLSEHQNLKPKKVILVAPWIDLEDYLKELNPESDYFDFFIDKNLAMRTSVMCMYSTDDSEPILGSVEKIKNEIPGMHCTVFTNKGHFVESDLGTKEFPELLELVLKK